MNSVLPAAFTSSILAIHAPHVSALQYLEREASALEWGDWGCPCVGIDGSVGEMNLTINGTLVSYPSNVGTSCEAWDDGRYPGACEVGGNPGKGKGFCAEKWCYVNPCTCDNGDPKKASYSPGATYKDRPLYYSYKSCGSVDKFTPQEPRKEASENTELERVSLYAAENASSRTLEAESRKSEHTKNESQQADAKGSAGEGQKLVAGAHKKGKDDDLKKICATPPDDKIVGKGKCKCIGIKHSGDKQQLDVHINDTTVSYTSDVGSYCSAWDDEVHPQCKSDGRFKAPKWCKASWCYIDPCTCNMKSVQVGDESAYISKARFEGNALFYSYKACGSDDAWTAANNPDACTNKQTESECTGECVWSKKEGHEESRCMEKVVSKYCKTKLEKVAAWEDGKGEVLSQSGEKAWWHFW